MPEDILKLCCLEGELKGQELLLKDDRRYTFGRSPDNDFPIRDVLLSRRHCMIEVKGGQAAFVDIGSSNGIYVNNQRVSRHILSRGDVISLGKSLWMVTPAEGDVSSEAGTKQGEKIEDGQALQWIEEGKSIRGSSDAPFYIERLALGYGDEELAAKLQEMGDREKLQSWLRDHPKIYPGLFLENGIIGEITCCGAMFCGPVRLSEVAVKGNFHAGERQMTDTSLFIPGASFQERVEIGGCVFDGEVNLVGVACAQSVLVKKSSFSGAANFSSIRCRRFLHFSDSRFDGDLLLRYARLEDEAGFNQCIFEDCVNLGNASIGREFFLRFCDFRPAARFTCRFVNFPGQVSLNNTSFSGEVDFTGSDFSGPLAAAHTVWKASVGFDRATVFGECDFSGALFEGALSWQGGALNRSNWQQAQFVAPVTFAKSRFAGDVSWVGAHFKGPASFAETRFEGVVQFNYHRREEKQPDCARFDAGADFTDALFYRRAIFCRLPFAAQARFDNAYFAEEANFQESIFGGDVSMQNVFCAQELNLQGARFSGPLRLDHANINRRLNLAGAHLNGISFYQAVLDVMVLEREQVEDNLIYQRSGDFGRLKEEYLILKASYQERGKFEEEDWAYRHYKRCERKRLSEERRARLCAPRHLLRRAGSLCGLAWNAIVKVIIDWGTGYGTQPLRVAVIAILVIAMFGSIYWGSSCYHLAQAPVSQPLIIFEGPEYGNLPPLEVARQVGFLDYVYFSTTTFTTMGFGDSHPNHRSWIRYVVMLEAIAGVFLMTLFVGTFIRKIIR